MRYTIDINQICSSDSIQPAFLRDYSVDAENELCLFIYEKLLEVFQECQSYASPYLNLVALFFHDLMRVLTSYVLQKNELELSGITKKNAVYYPVLKEFPYLGYREILEDVKLEEKQFPSPAIHISRKRALFSKISTLTARKRRCIAIVNPPINSRELIKKLMLRGYRLYFPARARIYVPHYNQQWTILRHGLEKIWHKVGREQQIPTMLSLIQSHIQAYLTTERIPANYDLMITGSLLDQRYRLLAANARANGIPVVCVSHGNGDYFVVDEPRTGCGELTYPSTIIGYGKKGKEILIRAKYSRGLYEQPEYTPANSNLAKKIFKKSRRIPELSELRNPKYMYVPTGLYGNLRYGPFHSVPDVVYYSWQKKVMRLFPKTIYKAHPKNKVLLKLTPGNIKTTMLEDCLKDADVFVFDVVSTAFNIAAATSKPIVFFDIGLRNLHPIAKKSIIDRCVWVEVNIDCGIEQMRERVVAQSDKQCLNGYTPDFCITDSNESREETIFRVIRDMLSR